MNCNNYHKNFHLWCHKILPLTYDDSLSYYEVLCKLHSYLSTLIENTELLSEDVENMKKELEEFKTILDSYNETLSDENLESIIKPLIEDVINKMVKSGIIIINSRWENDYDYTDAPHPIQATIPFQIATFERTARTNLGMKVEKIVNELVLTDSSSHFRTLYGLEDYDPTYSTKNGRYWIDTRQGFLHVSCGENSTNRQSLSIPIDETLAETPGYLYEITIDKSTMKSSSRGRVGFMLGGIIIYYDAEYGGVCYENAPSYTRVEWIKKDWEDIITISVFYLNNTYCAYINGELGEAITAEGRSIPFTLFCLLDNNDARIIKMQKKICTGYGFKDVSYVKFDDGTPFIANNRLYFTCVSSFYTGANALLMSHSVGTLDFKIESVLEQSVFNVIFDRYDKKFHFFMKNWNSGNLTYKSFQANAFADIINLAYPTEVKQSGNIDTFGGDGTAEDVDVIRFNECVYVAYTVRNTDNKFVLRVFKSTSSEQSFDLNAHKFNLIYSGNNDATGVRFIVYSNALLVLYGSGNLFRVLSVNNNYEIVMNNLEVDNRVWANFVPITTGDGTQLYLLTFDRMEYTNGTHGYGNLVMYRSGLFFDNDLYNKSIGIR